MLAAGTFYLTTRISTALRPLCKIAVSVARAAIPIHHESGSTYLNLVIQVLSVLNSAFNFNGNVIDNDDDNEIVSVA
jgi:hypothetical protein